MTIELKKLSPNDSIDIYNLLQDIPKEENGFTNGFNGLSYDDYKQWLIRSDNMANGIGLEDWMVPQYIFWLYVNEKPVGMGKLRLYLNDNLRKDGGHCGYCIVKSERNNGYGKLLLNLLMGKAKEAGLERVLLTIRNHNTASIKVALSNGGIIEKVSDEKHYIWLDCNIR